MEENKTTNILDDFGDIFDNLDLSDVSAEGTGYTTLPDGYYLCEVESAQVNNSKTSGKKKIQLSFKIVEDGFDAVYNEDGTTTLKELKGTKNRKVFKHLMIDTQENYKRAVSDLLKFEGSTPGKPILEKEYFMTKETLPDAVAILTGSRIYVNLSTGESNEQGQANQWCNLISWKRAAAMGLPIEE